MNRNVVFGAGLATLLVGAILVLTGGSKAPTVPAQVPVKGAPLPSLEPMMEPGEKAASTETKQVAPQAPSNH